MSGPAARLAAIRIDHASLALLLCGIASAFIGGCAFAYGMSGSGGRAGLAIERIALATFAGTLAILPASILLALPATWLGERLRLESLLYYLAAGTVAGIGCSLVIMGLPKGDEFLFEQVVRLTGPVFGASWGLLWWLTHRRWRRRAR